MSGSFYSLMSFPELKLYEWAQKFGSICSMWLGNQLFVVISDPNVVKDLLVSNGAIFSSRKEMYVKSKLVFAGRGITTTPYDDKWCVNLLQTKFFSSQTLQEEASSSRLYLAPQTCSRKVQQHSGR